MTTADVTPDLAKSPSILDTDPHDRAFIGHPRGLGYLAFTEAWERFSYYSMQTLLVLYMVNYLLLPGNREQVVGLDALSGFYGLQGQPLASAVFGTYTALVYLTPIFGGFLADRLLGRRRTIILGALLMTVGHFLMAFEASFLLALLFLILGVGAFKGNIASQVGGLYRPEDLRRTDAFQIFYIAINAGVIAAPLVAGSLGEKVGWHWGFGAAGVGMVIGLIIYLAGQKHLPPDESLAKRAASTEPRAPMARRDWLALGALVLLIPVLALALLNNQQIFNAYLVWGDREFDLVFFGVRLPTSWLIFLDTITSVSALVGVFAFWRLWTRWRRDLEEIDKMLIGAAFSIAGALCLVAAAATQPEGGKIGLFWPVMFHVFNSIAFAHMLPVSLALFARIAPKAINATVIGLYYLAFFAANSAVGIIGGWLETMDPVRFWMLHVGTAVTAGAIFLLYRLFLWRLIVPAPDTSAERDVFD